MLYSLIAVCIGYLLDLAIGDPQGFPHPIRLIGHLINKTEVLLRKVFPKTNNGELIAGVFMVIVVMAISAIIPFIVLFLLYGFNIYLAIIVEAIMCYYIFATRALKDESMIVHKYLKDNDVEGARQAVSMIVGRDTKSLDEKGISKATIETIAENASDGVIAPIIFVIIGGAPLGFLYKSINTMDSMIGYKNEKYLYLGRVAAILDDIVNYIPARISAYIMIFSTLFTKFNFKNSYRIYKRDKFNHASPNSAHTEAVMAGALDIQLAGDAYYFGKVVKKKTIGDDIREVTYKDISNANILMYTSSLVSIIIFLVIKAGILYLLK